MIGSIGFVPASAEVSITPNVVEVDGRQLFSVQVVSERDQPTNGVKIYIPEGVTGVRTFAKDKWNNTVDRDSSGEARSISWSGVTFIPSGQAQEFQFLAQIPDGEGIIEWEVEQSYLDNYIQAYGVDLEGDNVDLRGPITTQVVASVDTQNGDDTGFGSTLGWIALGISLVAVFLAFRSGSKANEEAASGAAKIEESKQPSKVVKSAKKSPKSAKTKAKSTTKKNVKDKSSSKKDNTSKGKKKTAAKLKKK